MTDVNAALSWLESRVQVHTGERFSELQHNILKQAWRGGRYLDAANAYGCTEGHAKDVGADLWQLLSEILGERVTKKNIRVVLSQLLAETTTPIDNSIASLANGPDIPMNFVGRAKAMADLHSLVQQGTKLIVIQGEGGVGKTTLAQQYLAQTFEQVLELSMAKETQSILAAEHIVEEWLKQAFQEEPGLEFGIALERLKRYLRQERIGVLIDNLEPALDASGQFFNTQRNYGELLRVLSDPKVKGLTLVTSRDRLCEPAVHAHHYKLSGLSLKAWRRYFSQQPTLLHEPTLEAMHHAYGGNAKAMRILAGVVVTEYDGAVEPYWQHQTDLLQPTDLKNLIQNQLSRLQNLDPQAYRLFCRLGCYRYQAVATVSLEAVLALLWDVPESQKRSALVALQNRSLIESHRGEYSLHPVLQEAARAILNNTPDWDLTQRAAAEYWSMTVKTIATTQDALKALEAYYHYQMIQDFAKAGRVLLKSRHNQWHQYLPLASTLYRMGLIQPLLSAIPTVLEQVKPDPELNELYNILGDVYWITGRIQAAIQTQETAFERSAAALQKLISQTDLSASHRSRYFQTLLGIDSRLSIGLYCLDLWDLARAADCFEQVIAQTKGTEHDRWAEKAAVCLALTQSYLGQQQAAHQQADEIYQTILREGLSENRGSFAYFLQLLGQTYVNLGAFETAQQLFEQALSFSEASHYTQVKAKTLTGLAIMQRQQEQYSEAITLHHQAISLLEALGATCDLAEAYYQLGLTYQAAGHPQGTASLQKAIALFEGMNAVRQIEKVKQSFRNL